MGLLELSGADWRNGQHHGTLVGAHGLELVPGVSRGAWEHTLDPEPSFTRLVASLNPEPWPVGAGIRASVGVRHAGSWSSWQSLGIYGSGSTLPQSESSPNVSADLLSCGEADGLRLRLELEAGELGGTPRLRRLALATWDDRAESSAPEEAPQAWGTTLDVPQRSQRVEAPELQDRVCSPTSLAMVLEFHGQPRTTAEVAEAVYDHGAQIYGNWSFNVAYAGEQGLRATATPLPSVGALESEIASGRPVVISQRYGAGELPGAPLADGTQGHLIVVVGFDANGDVVVNDPAAEPGAVRRTYARDAFRRSWLSNADGMAYLLSAC